MDFEQLGEVWRRLPGPEGARAPAEELEAVRARAAELDRGVRHRDYIETAVALVMLPVFVWLAVTEAHLVSAIGAAIVAGACVLVPIRLYWARHHPRDSGLPVAAALRVELRRVRAQERLLGSTFWWYFAPIGAGVILFVVGAPVSSEPGPAYTATIVFKVVYVIAVIVAYGFLLRLNRRAARERFAPVARQLEGWLANLDETSDNGASDVD